MVPSICRGMLYKYNIPYELFARKPLQKLLVRCMRILVDGRTQSAFM